MKKIINAENIQLNAEAGDWKDAMEKSGRLLVDSGYITPDYIDLTMRCVEENGPYIVITPGLALSHSRPDASVQKTGLSLLTLEEPINFGSENDPVDIILTLAATDDTSHLEMLQGMAEYISEEENLDAIRAAVDPEAAARAINEFEADI